MIDDDKPDDGDEPENGDAAGGHPEDQEEKGIGLTEEFARLEQEIKREVGAEPEAGESETGDGEAEEDDASEEAVDFGDTDSNEWVAPVPSGETEEWSAADGEPDAPEDEGAGARPVPRRASTRLPSSRKRSRSARRGRRR